MDRLPKMPNVSNEALVFNSQQLLTQLRESSKKQSYVSDIEVTEKMADNILKESRILSKPLVSRIERIDPGGRFGINKVEEMQQLADQSESVGIKLNLEKRERNLLKIILGTHDLGRFVEKDMNLNTLRNGVRHGVFSMNFLNENNILDGLSDSDKYIILFSVYYHAEKDVPKPSETSSDFENTAYDMCYFLRDLDKMHYFEELNFFEAKGVLAQIKDHYLDDSLRKELTNTGTRLQALSLLDDILNDRPIEDISSSPLSKEIIKIMNTGVDRQMIECIEAHKLAPIQVIKHSWSTYLALRLSTLFDIKNKYILEKIFKEDDEYIKKSLDFISLKDPAAADIIAGSLNNYSII